MAGCIKKTENQKKLDFAGKRVLVMGLGLHGGGAGAVEFFARQGARVTVTDLRTRRELTPTLRALARLKGVRYVLGEHRPEDFRAADLIVKNPGVRRDSPYLKDALKRGIPVTSDIAIFFNLCPARIVGITGTRGKSTTTYLIWRILKTKFGSRVHYGGNIRRSVLGILPEIKRDDLVVLELSSFQLMDLAVERKSPAVAVLTNIMHDHLNWHRDMREYREAKSAIFRYQHAGDALFIPAGDTTLRRLAAQAPGRVSKVRLPMSLQGAVDHNLGAHYRPAAALAAGVARHFGVAPAAIARTITAFKGLESRQHSIGDVRGVHFIDDTTATIPDAAIAAIRRFRGRAGADHQLILIAGGQDKKLDFGAMIAEMKKSADVVVLLPGNATDRMLGELNPDPAASRRVSGRDSTERYRLRRLKKSFAASIPAASRRAFNGIPLRIKKQESRAGALIASSMREAVRIAFGFAKKGDYILLSPGAASFGLFLNEFDRGEKFARAVKTLRKKL